MAMSPLGDDVDRDEVVAEINVTPLTDIIERRVRASWKFPESLGGTTQTVKIGFALGPEGSLRDVRVVSSSSALNDSALAAMKRAAPFPPLPEKFRRLAGQPLVLSFTVTIR